MALDAGQKLGAYEILGAIGKGGMGEVYRARDTRLNRDVAIKVASEQFNERFEREARAIAALNHPNIWMRSRHSPCREPPARAIRSGRLTAGRSVSSRTEG